MSAPAGSTAAYLRRDVAAEPLISRFHAWAQLVAPATSALQLARAQLAICDSFAQNPALHAAAVRDPRLRGGPFLDLPSERVGDVRALASALRERRAPALAFAAAVTELERLLETEGSGSSLEPLYARVPEPLRGAVELVYDARNRPGFRLIERLLYASPLYDREEQGFVVRRLAGDARAFALSTPRFAAADAAELDLALPFDHPGVEALFRARRSPVAPAELGERLALAPDDEPRLRALMTEQAPPEREAWASAAPRVRYFGHACVLLETRATSVLVDPLIGYASAAEPPRYTLDDLPARIDYVVITHGHQDHVVLETLLQLKERVGTVVVPRSGAASSRIRRCASCSRPWASRASSSWTSSSPWPSTAARSWGSPSWASTATCACARSSPTSCASAAAPSSSPPTRATSSRASTPTCARSRARSTRSSSAWSATARR